MAYNFISCDRGQKYLLPPSLLEWLPEGDLTWFILDAVEQMEVEDFYKKHRSDGWGRAAFEPSMMVSLLLYGYCMGERSSRRIEQLCERDIGFRVIAANQRPDHSTIARFRKEHEKELEKLFTEVLKLCAEAGLVKVGIVALDGTKMKAHAALSSNRTQKHIEEEVEKMLEEAASKDAEEDRKFGKDKRGDELPEELRGRQSRLIRLKECKERLEREATEVVASQQRRIDEREAEEAETGRKKRGRKPKEPEEVKNKEAKANITDPESRIMKGRVGYVQGYNGQAVVTEGQIIVAAELTQEENDVQQLDPMVKKAGENLIEVGVKEEMGVGVADAGYWSEANVKDASGTMPELLIAMKKDWKQREAIREQEPPRGRIPDGLSERERMERKLLTKRGKRLYSKRGQMIEAVFEQIKEVRRMRRFIRRGLSACASEWKLMCATHNLLKLFRSGKACWV